jgi:hypothetical protein
MVLKLFLVYIGAFLAGAVALVFVAKSFAPGFAVNTKKPVLQGGISAIVGSGAAYGATLFSDYLFTVYWAFAFIFLLLGIIHVLVFHNKYFYAGSQDNKKAIIGELVFILALLFFIIVVFSSLQYFLQNKNFLFFPMLMSMLAFFIPVSVYYTFEAAYNIPQRIYPVWQYPLNSTIELPDEQPNEKVLVIAFEACKNATDTRKTNFRAKGPETMKLGDLYYHFINDYNEFQSETPIQYADQQHGQHEWWFRIKPKWYQQHRILDPELTVRENRIRENSVIICERI